MLHPAIIINFFTGNFLLSCNSSNQPLCWYILLCWLTTPIVGTHGSLLPRWHTRLTAPTLAHTAHCSHVGTHGSLLPCWHTRLTAPTLAHTAHCSHVGTHGSLLPRWHTRLTAHHVGTHGSLLLCHSMIQHRACAQIWPCNFHTHFIACVYMTNPAHYDKPCPLQ